MYQSEKNPDQDAGPPGNGISNPADSDQPETEAEKEEPADPGPASPDKPSDLTPDEEKSEADTAGSAGQD
jgi:hypothetical protein